MREQWRHGQMPTRSPAGGKDPDIRRWTPASLVTKILLTLVAVASFLGCTQPPAQLRVSDDVRNEARPDPQRPPGLFVRRSGFAVLGNRISFAALVRNPTDKTLGDISLRVTLRDPASRRVDSFLDDLPYCPARQGCWWGSSFVGRDFGRRWRETSAAEVRVVEAGGPYRTSGRPPMILRFRVERTRTGAVRGRAPADEGIAFIVGFKDGEPRSGIGLNIRRGMGFGLDVRVPRPFLPRLGRAEELRGFMYPVAVAAGS